MMKKNISVLLVCAALAAPLAAQAQSRQTSYGTNPHYTWVDGRIVELDPDGPGGSETGLRIGGSMMFQDNLFGVASITDVDEYSELAFGAGLRHPLDSGMDLVGMGGLLWADNPVDDDIGFFLTGGVRALVAPQFELGGYVGYRSIFDEGDIELTGEGLLHITRELSLVASLGFSDDYDLITIGARWNLR
jgi:hypothetical protein